MAQQATDPAVTAILKETKPGLDEHRIRERRYDHAYEVWRAVPPKGQGPSSWSSRVRVKLAMQTIDTALVNMVSGNKPKCRVTARTPDWQQNEQAFSNVFDYFIDRDHIVEKEPLLVQSGLIYGIAVAKNDYIFTDQQTGPCLTPWDIYDCWWDPNGRDVDTCTYVVLRSWPTKDYLLSNSCHATGDHDREQCDGIYHNVDELVAMGTGRPRTSTSQETFLGSQQNLRKDRYEVWEVWRDNRVTVIGNRTVLLRDDPNPHQHGKKPIVMASTRPDLHKIQGVPETELIDDIQQSFWHVHNLRLENEHLTVHRAITYREGGVVDPDALELKPRAKWGVTDHDDVRPFEVQPLPPEAYRETEDLLSLASLVTGINAFVSGGPQQGVDQNTATGVSVLSEVSSRLLRFKASRLRWNIWQRTYEQWGADIQQYMDEPLWVKLVGKGDTAPQWVQYSPADIEGEFDFALEGTDDSLSKQQDRQDSMALLNALAPFAQLGIVNMQPVIEKVARAFGFEHPEQLLNTPQQPQAAPFGPGPPGTPPNGAQPPMPNTPEQGIVPGQNMQPGLQPGMMQQMAAARLGQGQ